MSHSSNNITLRAADIIDLDWLLDLRLQTMASYIEKSGQKLLIDGQRDRVLQRYDCIRIVEMEAQPVGMIKVIRDQDPWQLVQIQLRPQHQGQGFGTTLIRQLLADAKCEGVSISLHVLKVNPAKNLYSRLGFKVTADGGCSYEMQYNA